MKLFRVPFHDAVRSKKWTNVIGINETSNKNCFVCERHFKSCDFDHNGIGVNVKKLKLSAVPSLFLPVVNNLFKNNNDKFINITYNLYA